VMGANEGMILGAGGHGGGSFHWVNVVDLVLQRFHNLRTAPPRSLP
jgi:enoyl reductase-like protein